MKKHQILVNCTSDDAKPDTILFDGEVIVDLNATGMSLEDGLKEAFKIVDKHIRVVD